MQLIINQTAFDTNASIVTSRIVPIFAPGTARSIRYRQIINATVTLFGDGSDQLAQIEAKVRLAMNTPYPSIVFLTDSGAASPESLQNSLTGAKITSGPDFVDAANGEHVTLRTMRFTAEAQYVATGAGKAVLFWRESITRIGNGGPLVVLRFPINQTGAIPQQITPSSQVTVIHSGNAIGHSDYVDPPTARYAGNGVSAPILANPEETVQYGSPDRTDQLLHSYPTSWQYVYKWDRYFMPIPSVPPL